MMLCALVLIAGTYFLSPKTETVSTVAVSEPVSSTPETSIEQPQSLISVKPDVIFRKQALQQTPRVLIQTPELQGSINLKGARFDDLELNNYHETIDKNSPSLILFSPEGAEKAYHADTGWIANGQNIIVPNHETLWTCSKVMLTPSQPIILEWDNGQGLTFEKHITIDDKFLITVVQKVKNKSAEKVILSPYSFLIQRGTPKTEGYFILHEGLLGVVEGTLKEIEYKKLQDQKTNTYSTQGGWLGITDKYMLAAILPEQQNVSQATFRYTPGQVEGYQVDYIYPAQVLDHQQEISSIHHIFAGTKILSVLDRYSEQLNVAKLDLAIDFGWFYFLTKPLFHLMGIIHQLLGNFGFAIILLTVLVKLIFFPLANRSYRSMAMMKALQPEIETLQKRYGDDKIKLNQEIMALYKRKSVNPLSGCLPIIVQFPVFFALYKVLFINIEMRHAPFVGWIHDLSAPDPTSLFNAFGLIPWTPPELLAIGIWPLLMGVTMVLQQRLNPQPADPVQAKMFMILPLIFTVMLARFPVGLVIYWTWSNILSILQQWAILRMGAKSQNMGQIETQKRNR